VEPGGCRPWAPSCAGLAGGLVPFCCGAALFCAGAAAWPPRPAAGYEVYTLPLQIVGVLVSGSPRKLDQRCLPVLASSAKMVHDSVLKITISSAHTAEVGPSSSRSTPQMTLPVRASQQ